MIHACLFFGRDGDKGMKDGVRVTDPSTPEAVSSPSAAAEPWKDPEARPTSTFRFLCKRHRGKRVNAKAGAGTDVTTMETFCAVRHDYAVVVDAV